MRNPALIAIAVFLCSVATVCTHNDTGETKEWPRLTVAVDTTVADTGDCGGAISSHADAVTMLVTQSACTDKAIAALQAFAERDANAMSDLGAAYYIRAQREQRPSDLLLAFDAASDAVRSKPQPAVAAFNLQLFEKSLGLTDFHHDWSPDRLAAALHRGDAAEVARLIKPYPASAQRYLDDELLPLHMNEARLLAAQLTNITGDRYPIDEVNAASPRAAPYAAAALGDAAALDRIERDARQRGYWNLVAYVLSMRGYDLFFNESRYLDALTNYDAALKIYERLHNPESVAATQTRRIGILRVTGQYREGWNTALQLCLNIRQLPSIRERVLLLDETAALADKLGHSRAASMYAAAAVHLVQKELAAAPPENIRLISMLQHVLGVALRNDAAYALENDDYDRAQRELAESTRLSEEEKDPEFRRSLEARLAEVKAQALLHVDPARAAEQFTAALDLSKDLEYRSFRASLYAQRAVAEKAKPADAERDLRNALAELNDEESNLFQQHSGGDYEKLVWSAYFSRFQDTYHALIRQLIGSNRAAEAFVYADRARAFEPLNLALKLEPANAARIDVAQVQKLLPRGTFLVEYAILDDRTFAWVITNDAWHLVTLPAQGRTIDRWSATLQRAAREHDFDAFDATLFAAYDQLLTAPLAVIAQMPGGARPRLVFVPDGAMYGIPFSALRNPITRRYVIEDAPVEMAGSAALYALSVKRDRVLPRDTSALLIGNPSAVRPLRGAEAEVKQLEPIYAPHAIVRIGSQATIDDFLKQAADNAIVHVAAHAIVDPETPSRSSLLFASGELDAAQLLARLNPGRTRLVVLAACSSARGLPIGPEGVGPLVRPLIAKGVPAVIGSLWDVNDATAEPLLVSFHQHYRKGSDAAEAMQLAQLDLLRNPNSGLQSVLAWAPFQVIGHGSSPFAPSR